MIKIKRTNITIMTNKEFKNKIKKEIQETEKLFNMGLLTPQERFERDFESKKTLKKHTLWSK